MIKSKVITIFSSFDKKEKAAFRKWVNSKLHNQRKDITKLTEYLLSRRKITATAVRREKVYPYIYPAQVYDATQFNHLLSLTGKVMEDFIKNLMSKKQPFKDEILLYSYYKERNIAHLAKNALIRGAADLEGVQYRNEAFYYDSFSLEQATFDLLGTEQRRLQTNLDAIFTNLATFTIISTLRYACIALSHKSLFKKDYYVPLLDAILEEAAKDTYDDNPVVKCYFHSYMALAFPEQESHFQELTAILLVKELPLSIAEQKYICLLAINYCIKRLNTGAESYVQEVFNIYKFGLEHQIWIENGHLSHITFKNIAIAALRLKAYNWTEYFIAQYGPLLTPDYESIYTNFIKAKLLFELQQYQEAQRLLINISPNDLFIGLAIKVLLLKIYYVQEDYTLLESHLDSFTVYLNRKKVLAYHKQIYSQTISIIRKMIYTNLEDNKKREEIRDLIHATPALPERPWLLAQLD